MNLNLKNFPLRDFKDIYSEMHNIVKEYSKLNHRNHKKDEDHLNKHSMHLVRLYLMGIEIMEGKGVNTYREKDRDLLLSIRSGNYTKEQIFMLADEYEKKFVYACDNSPLPEKPDHNKVEELVIEINKRILTKLYLI